MDASRECTAGAPRQAGRWWRPRHAFVGVCAVVASVCGLRGSAAPPDARRPFVDTFARAEIGDAWTVHEGQWAIEDAALICKDGGVISLSAPPGGSFEMEFEIAFPGLWMSVIPYFTSPRDYGTLYLGVGYWETFELSGENLGHYVQRQDADIQRPGGFQKVTVAATYGVISFTYDGKAKGPAQLAYRPGSQIAFRSLPGSGLLKIRNFKLRNLPTDDAQMARVEPASLAKATTHADRELDEVEGKIGPAKFDKQQERLALGYSFEPSRVFESRFVRVPVGDVPKSRLLVVDVQGDGSRNGLFIIVHDASGEQHLVLHSPLAWSGWQDVGANLEPFLTPPPNMERSANHWGGDGNQVIDFPITAVDIGVAKRGEPSGSRGTLSLRKVRFRP